MNCNNVINVDYFTVALISEQLFQPGCCAEKGVLDIFLKINRDESLLWLQ
jgi:hypothetical protein